MKTIALFLTIALLFGGVARAQDYPSRTVQVITHAGDGGGTDVTTRMVLLRGRYELQTDMQVENRRGGGGAVAMDYFLQQPRDGHTILAFTTGHAVTMAKGETELRLEDLRPIARGTQDPQILMARCDSFADAEAFVAQQKQTALRYGTTLRGSIDEISAFLFTKRGGLQPPEIMPYGGGGELARQLVAGEVDVAVLNLSEAGGGIDRGDICPLVVLAEQRMAALPQVVTARELGIDAVFSTVRGFVVHQEVPDAVALTLEQAFMRAMNNKIYQGYLQSVGLEASSAAGAALWGRQLTRMVAEMEAALQEMATSR